MFRPLKELSKDVEDTLTPSAQYDFICCILTFVKGRDLTFPAFKRAWDHHNLSLAHHALPKYTESHLHLQLLYGAALSLLAPTIPRPGGNVHLPDELAWKVGVVYLIYALYKTQPGSTMKPIRVCPATWQRLQDLRHILSRPSLVSVGGDASCILELMMEEKAFIFVAYDGPPGMFAGTQSNFFYSQYQHRTSITPSVQQYMAMVEALEEMRESQEVYKKTLARIRSRPSLGEAMVGTALEDPPDEDTDWEQVVRPALEKVLWGGLMEYQPPGDLLREPLMQRWNDRGAASRETEPINGGGGLQDKQQPRAGEGEGASRVSAPGRENVPETSSVGGDARPGVRGSRRDRELQRMQKQEQELAKKREKERQARIKAQAEEAAKSQEDGAAGEDDLMQELFQEFDEGSAFPPSPSSPHKARRESAMDEESSEDEEEGSRGEKGKAPMKRSGYKSTKDQKRIQELEKRVEKLGPKKAQPPQKRLTEVVGDLMKTIQTASVKVGKSKPRPQGGGKKPRQPREESEVAKQLRKSQNMLQRVARGGSTARGKGRKRSADELPAVGALASWEQPMAGGGGGGYAGPTSFESLDAVLRGEVGGAAGAAQQPVSESDAQLSELEMLLGASLPAAGGGGRVEVPLTASQEEPVVSRRQTRGRGSRGAGKRQPGRGAGAGRSGATKRSRARKAEPEPELEREQEGGGGMALPGLDVASLLEEMRGATARPSAPPPVAPAPAPAPTGRDLEAPASSDEALNLLEELLGQPKRPEPSQARSGLDLLADLAPAPIQRETQSTSTASEGGEPPAAISGQTSSSLPSKSKNGTSTSPPKKARRTAPPETHATIQPPAPPARPQPVEKDASVAITGTSDENLLELEALLGSAAIPSPAPAPAPAPSTATPLAQNGPLRGGQQSPSTKLPRARQESRRENGIPSQPGGAATKQQKGGKGREGPDGDQTATPESHEPIKASAAKATRLQEEDEELELLLALEEEEEVRVAKEKEGKELGKEGTRPPPAQVEPEKGGMVEEEEEDDDAFLMALEAEEGTAAERQGSSVGAQSSKKHHVAEEEEEGEDQDKEDDFLGEEGGVTVQHGEGEQDDDDDEALLLRLAAENSRAGEEEEDDDDDFLG